MEKWVITGSKGFIGARLKKQVPDATGIDKKWGKDVRDWSVCGKAASHCDVWAHLAADSGVPQSYRDPVRTFDNNVIGLQVALESCRNMGVNRFLFASTGGIKGPSPYSLTKRVGEDLCDLYNREFGLSTLSLRFSNVYGPGSDDKTSVVAKMCKDAYTHGVIIIEGSGKQTRDFIHVDDVVNMIIHAAHSPVTGYLNIATGEQHSILEVANLISECTGAPIEHISGRKGDPLSNHLETEITRERLSYAPEKRFRDGIIETCVYFAEAYSVQVKKAH